MGRRAATAFLFAITALLQIGLAQAQPFALTGLWRGVLSPKDRVYPWENNASTIAIVLDITQNGNSFRGTLGWAVVNHPEQFIRYNVDGQISSFSNQATLKLDSSGRVDSWLGSNPCPTNMAGLATQRDRGIYLALGRSSSDGCPYWVATLKLVRGAPDMLPILADRVVKAFNKGSLSEKASALVSFASACVIDTGCRKEVLKDPRLKTWAQVEAVLIVGPAVLEALPAGAASVGETSTVERALVSAARIEASAGATVSRSLTAADLGLSEDILSQLDGTVVKSGSNVTVTFNMIEAELQNPIGVINSLKQMAAGQGASTLTINGYIANEKLLDVLVRRYGAVSSRYGESFTIKTR